MQSGSLPAYFDHSSSPPAGTGRPLSLHKQRSSPFLLQGPISFLTTGYCRAVPHRLATCHSPIRNTHLRSRTPTALPCSVTRRSTTPAETRALRRSLPAHTPAHSSARRRLYCSTRANTCARLLRFACTPLQPQQLYPLGVASNSLDAFPNAKSFKLWGMSDSKLLYTRALSASTMGQSSSI